MPLPLRQEAVAAVFDNEEAARLHGPLLDELATVAGFRRRTMARMAPEQLARYAGRLPARKLPFPSDVFRTFLTGARTEMLGAYLEALGFEHEEGRVLGEPEEPEAADARKAAEAILARFHPDDVFVYLAALARQTPPLAPGIPEWLEERLGRTEGGPTEEGEGEAPADLESDTPEPQIVREAREEVPEENLVPGSPFTALDRLLIRAAVDCAQGVVGAPDRDTVEDMVDEVVELNSFRHASYFHRGFVDGLFEDERREGLPAENEDRRHWYLAGWITALARRDRDPEIAELADEAPTRELVGSGTPAGALAVPLLFRSLCRVGREPEAATLVTARDLLHDLRLMRPFLNEGTRLLREDDAVRARPFFDRLGEVVRRLEAEGEETTERFFLEIRRRRAHCFRQLGEEERARELLARLLEEDPDPAIRAMVLADLGLLEAGYRALADVRLWRSEQERTDILNGLERGRARFEAAAETGGRFASHGAWPLAVLHLARGEGAKALPLLTAVLSTFLEHAQRYRGRGLLTNVRAATGIARALEMDYNRLPKAKEELVAGLREGARIPPDLLGPVLGALDEHEDELAGPVLAAVLEAEGPGVLDGLGDAELVRRTPAAADHLLARAAREDAPRAQRAADLRRAVGILLADPGLPGHLDRARESLDTLEELARSGVGREEYLELLDDPARVDPAWGAEEAAWSRIQILEAREAYDDAVAELRSRMAAALTEGRWTAAEDGEAMLARARSYGLDPEWTEDMERRLEAWKRENGADEEEVAPYRTAHPNQVARVLIVGGDERQRELEERVRRRLEADGDAIRVHHIATGWSGNWSHKLDEVLRSAEGHDALVLLQYMRTEFGRSLRASLGDKPWASCRGVGTLQVTRVVRRAAGYAGG